MFGKSVKKRLKKLEAQMDWESSFRNKLLARIRVLECPHPKSRRRVVRRSSGFCLPHWEEICDKCGGTLEEYCDQKGALEARRRILSWQKEAIEEELKTSYAEDQDG